MRRLFRASIWHPEAIPVEEWKYRNLKRVWLPLYFALAFVNGILAAWVGSRLLHRLFGEQLTDWLGFGLAAVGAVCFAAVAFPRLWAVAIPAVSTLVGMVLAYVGAILLFPSPDRTDPAFFIAGMLFFGLPFAMFYVNLLGEEWKERRDAQDRDDQRAREARNLGEVS